MARQLARAAARALRSLQSSGSHAEAIASVAGQRSCLHYAASSSQLPAASLPSTSYSLATSQHGWAGSSFQSRGSVRGMFIQTQPTPNPNSLIFAPGKTVMESGSYEFPNAREGVKSPLAKKLFTIDGISSVFFGSDFVTVTKKDEYAWPVLKPDVFAAIMDFYSSGEKLFTDADALARSDTAIHEDDSEVVAMIKELLETRVRPAVQEDGGDIVYRGFEEDTGIVMVKLVGACSTCPSSTVTLKSGIENMLIHYIPEVKGVIEAPPDEGEVEALKVFAKLDVQLSAEESSTAGSQDKAAAAPAAPAPAS